MKRSKIVIIFYSLVLLTLFQNCGEFDTNQDVNSFVETEQYNGMVNNFLDSSEFIVFQKEKFWSKNQNKMQDEIYQIDQQIEAEIYSISTRQVLSLKIKNLQGSISQYQVFARIKLDNDIMILEQSDLTTRSLNENTFLIDLSSINLDKLQSLKVYVIKPLSKTASLATIAQKAFVQLADLVGPSAQCDTATSSRETFCFEKHEVCQSNNSLGFLNQNTNLNECEVLSCKKTFAPKNGSCRKITKICSNEIKGLGVVFSGEESCSAIACFDQKEILFNNQCLNRTNNNYTDSIGTGIATYDEESGKFIITKYKSCNSKHILYKDMCHEISVNFNSKAGQGKKVFNIQTGKYDYEYKSCNKDYYLNNKKCVLKEVESKDLKTAVIWDFNKKCSKDHYYNILTKKCHKPINTKNCSKDLLQNYQSNKYFAKIRYGLGNEKYIEVFSSEKKQRQELVLAVNNFSSISYCKFGNK